jgi:ABC-type transport system substrate-binding protein
MIFRLTPSDAHDLETAGYKIILGNRPPTFYLIPDGANPESPFHNIKVREAVEYAIDKKAIVSGIGYGYYKVVDDFAPPGQTFSGLQPRNYDPRKAKQLLSEAGFPTGFKTKLMAPTTADRTALTAVQTYLKAVGIDATVDLADISRIVTITQQGWTNGILFPMSPTNGDLVSVSRFYGDKRYISAYVSAFRPSGWFEKLASAISDPNETSRAAKAHELLRMMSEQAMGIPLWTLPSIAAQDKTVHNLGWSQGMDLYAQWAEAWLSTSTM